MNLNSKQTYTTTIFNVDHLENSYTITYNDESNAWEVVDDLNDDVEDKALRQQLIDYCKSDNKTYVLFGSDMVGTADNTSLNAKAIAETIHNGVNSMTNLQAFEPNTPIGDIIESVIGWGDYMVIGKAKYDEIKSEYAKLESPESDTEFSPTPTPPKVWRDNDQEELSYYARQCDITGEGMNEGWVIGGGFFYIKHEEDVIAYCKEKWNQTLAEAYEESELNDGGDSFYWTSWEDESEYQYRFVDGVLIEEDDERFPYDYEEPIDEDTLKQEYFTPTEEMQHRMAMILDDLAKLREFIEENGIGYVFDKATKYTDSAWTHLDNIEIACDIDSNESLGWSKYSK